MRIFYLGGQSQETQRGLVDVLADQKVAKVKVELNEARQLARQAEAKVEAMVDEVKAAQQRRLNAEQMLSEAETVNINQSRRLAEATAV